MNKHLSNALRAAVIELDCAHMADDDHLFSHLAHNAWPALLVELRRLWAIEEAAVSMREARNREELLAVGSEPISDAELREYDKAIVATCDCEEALFAALIAEHGDEGKQ